MDIEKALLIKFLGESLITQTTDIQEQEIRISINLPYVQGTSEKLQRILRSHKIRTTFYTVMTLRKLLCKQRIE